jgi:hypothetical protein
MLRSLALLTTLLCAILSHPAAAEKRVALVIGIDTFDNLSADVQLKRPGAMPQLWPAPSRN